MKTDHVLLVDLPHGPADLGSEIEVSIAFTFEPTEPARIEFVAASPAEPFSGPFADVKQTRLAGAARDWLEDGPGREVALNQVSGEQEDMS